MKRQKRERSYTLRGERMEKLFVAAGLLILVVGLYCCGTPYAGTGDRGYYPNMGIFVIIAGILFLVAGLFTTPEPEDASKKTLLNLPDSLKIFRYGFIVSRSLKRSAK